MAIYGIILAIVFTQKVGLKDPTTPYTFSDYFTGARPCPPNCSGAPSLGAVVALIRPAFCAVLPRGAAGALQATACSGPA